MSTSVLRRHLTFANMCSLLALIVATSTGAAYAANTVRSKDIVNGQVRTVDLRDSSVTSAKLKDGSVGLTDLLTGSVDSSRIVDATVTSADIADGSIDAVDLLVASITGAKLANDTITAAQLATGAVGAAELGAGSVNGSKVANDSLTFADLESGSGTGTVSVPANDVVNGRCEQKSVAIGGAETGDAVVFSVRGAVQAGVFFYATQVTAPGTVVLQLCNFSGVAMTAITDLPIRVLTFH